MTASEYIVISNRADTPFPVTRNLSEEPQPEAPPAEQAPRRALGFPEQGSKGSGYLSARAGGGGGGAGTSLKCNARQVAAASGPESPHALDAGVSVRRLA